MAIISSTVRILEFDLRERWMIFRNLYWVPIATNVDTEGEIIELGAGTDLYGCLKRCHFMNKPQFQSSCIKFHSYEVAISEF